MNPQIDKSAEPGKTVAVVKPAEPTLEGWKEIATFLKRDVRTVMRWEKSEGLPVRRHLHNQRSSVYALPPELKSWQAARAPQPAVPQKVAWWRPRPAVGLAAAIFLLMFSFRGGPLAELQAQAQSKPAPMVTNVYDDLRFDFDGAVSPDGKRFAEMKWDIGELVVWDLATHEMKRVTDFKWGASAEEPRWSPDGQRLAYSVCTSAPMRCELRISQATGGEPEVAFRSDAQRPTGVLDWSPDGKTILIALQLENHKAGMGAFNVADHSMLLLRAFDTGIYITARFSPDSTTVAYEWNEGGKRRLALMSMSEESSTRIESAADDQAPIWSRDGRDLLFVSNRSGHFDLWAVRVTNGKPADEPRIVYPDIGNTRRIAGWLDDHTLLYSKNPAPSGNFQTVPLALPDGTLLDQPKAPIPYFFGQHTAARWSPDGESISFVAGGGAEQRLYVYTPKTKKLRTVDTGELARYGIAGWYPSGDALVLWSPNNTKGIPTLYRVGLSGQVQEIYADERARGTVGSVSPDVSRFAYVCWVQGQNGTSIPNSICVYDLRNRKMLKEIAPPAGTTYFQPQLSADPKSVIFVAGSGPHTQQIREQLMAAPVGPGEPRVIATFEPGYLGRLAGSPDGAYVAYTWAPLAETGLADWKRLKFFVRSTREGAKEEPLELPKYAGTSMITWSPDSKQIGYITAESKPRWLALSNFLPQ